MPPVNVSFAAALDLGSVLPIDNTQSNINDAAVNYTVFYKFTCPTGLKMVWAWATSDGASVYTPKMIPYDQAQVEILTDSANVPPVVLGNNPIQFPVTPGQIHFLQVVTNANTAGPERVDLQIKAVPDTVVIPLRAIVINGDIVGQPLGIHSPTTNYQTVKFVQGVAIGEGGCITKTGKTLFENRVITDRKLKLYDASFVELGSVAIPSYGWIRRNQTTGFFWFIAMDTFASELYKINPEVLPLAKTLVATFTTGSARGISTNNAESVAYYAAGTFPTAVKRWNLLTDTAMADLVAPPSASYIFLDSLVLEDDSIIVGWSVDDGVPANMAANPIRYNAAGAVLNDYGIFPSYEIDFGAVRLAYDPDSPVSFWVRLREMTAGVPTGDAIFKRIRVADGAILQTVNHLEYNHRNYVGPVSPVYRAESGAWNSCPTIIYPLGVTSPSGIFITEANRRNDNDVAIPAPTFRTGLVP